MIRRIKYYNEKDEAFKEHTFEYPSELELLRLFPEAKRIIPQKIREWEAEKEALLQEETVPIFKKINAIEDERSRTFWKLVYLAFSRRRKEIFAHLSRLRRLKTFLAKPAYRKGYENFDAMKAVAKDRPIQELYNFEKLRKVGKGWIGCCPFHDDRNPSFQIFPDNKYRCYSCGESGDSIDFVKKIEGRSFSEAVATLGGGR